MALILGGFSWATVSFGGMGGWPEARGTFFAGSRKRFADLEAEKLFDVFLGLGS